MNVPGLIAAIAFLIFSLFMAWGVQQFTVLTNHKVGDHRVKRSRWCPICREVRR